MERRMLINAAQSEECRIAIIDDRQLIELEIESHLAKKLKGNIYKAKIARIEPSLQAAFLDLGTTRNGFLQINDVHPALFKENTRGRGPKGKVRMQDVLSAGQEIIVQVIKEERELKGATLSTYLSLPGRYLVLMPGSDRGGVSRKINDPEHRRRLKLLSQEFELPDGMGVIIRTAGLDRSMSDLSRDLETQLKVWERVVSSVKDAKSPEVLYAESDLALRVVRDYFNPDIREILIDDLATFERVRDFVGNVMPRYRSRIKHYSGELPLFSLFAIEDQVADTLRPEIKLRSGGSIVIEQLEALVAIDVNSGKATTQGDIEQTALKTNLEAADEVARQLRLRDLGGLVVVDFIDMLDRRNRAAVEKQIREAVKMDKARIELGTLSKFGLLEMSRQRIRASITSQSHLKCQFCQGSGFLRNPELVALEILRKIQTASAAGHLAGIKVRASPGVAMFLLNNKRAQIVSLEEKYKLSAMVLADGRLTPGEYEFELETSKFIPEAQIHAQDPNLSLVEQEIDEEDLKPSTLLDDELEEESALAIAHAAHSSNEETEEEQK
jgi:ribonuclease E